MSPKIGIALGGGGARGLAHVGVLKVLEEEGIPLHCITGSSMGAIVGAAYAQDPDAGKLIKTFRGLLNEELFNQIGLQHLKNEWAREGSFLHQAMKNIKKRIVLNLAMSRPALLKDVRLREILVKFIQPGDIMDTQIPLGIVTTSLNTGQSIFFRTGDIINALTASSSIPSFFYPTWHVDDLLTDGAVSCPVPVEYLAEMGAEITIGVEINLRHFPTLSKVDVIEIMTRAGLIASRNLGRLMVEMADVAICPDTKDIQWSGFDRAEELIQAGIQITREKLPEIRAAMQSKAPWYKRLFLK